MKLRRIAGVVAAAATSLAFAATPAFGQGAQIIEVDECQEWSFTTVCVNSRSIFNRVDTPSGNSIIIDNGHFSTTFVGKGELAGFSEQDSGFYTNRYHIFNDATSQVSNVWKNWSLQVRDGTAIECEYQLNVVFTMGEVRHNQTRLECTDPTDT
jgi:hypothetical protein